MYISSGNQIPIIEIQSNATTIHALMDTGATYSLIDFKLAMKLKSDFQYLNTSQMVCADGSKVTPLGKLKLSLYIGEKQMKHEFYIMEKLVVSCIIGADFLRRYNIVIHLQEQIFWFGDETEKTYKINETFENKPRISLTIGKANGEYNERERKKLIRDLLIKYNKVARTDNKYGRTDWTYHVIESDGNPVQLPIIPYPVNKRQEINNQVEKLLENRMIEHSTSNYSSPVVLVKKKNNEWRMCVNYTKLNAQTKSNCSPMESVHSMIRQIPQGYLYSTIDLLSGYWQVMLAKESIEKTAFTTQDGHYHFLVMPFGLKNAPKTFQNLMRKVLHGYLGKFTRVFIDDIIVYSKTVEQHLEDLEKVFERLQEANIVMNVEKSHFFKKEVEYLGHIIGQHGIRKKPETMRAIQDFPVPISKKDILRFMGLCQWYHSFMKDLAVTAEPLYKLTKKDTQFQWEADQQKAFETLKQKLCEEVTLSAIDYSKPIILKTDASEIGVGGCLCNLIDGQERPIAWVSKLLKKSERNAHIYEKEAYAVIFCYHKFREFLDGQEFTIQVDNRAVQFIRHMRDRKPKIMRWAIEIGSWNAEIELKAGKHNVEADALSRSPVKPIKGELDLFNDTEEYKLAPIATVFGTAISAEKLVSEQAKDKDLLQIIEALKDADKASAPKSNEDDKMSTSKLKNYKIVNGILMKKILYDLKKDPNGEEGLINAIGDLYGSYNLTSVISSKALLEGIDCQNEENSDRSKESDQLYKDKGQKRIPKIKVQPEKKQERKFGHFYVPIIPKSLRGEIMKLFHDDPQAGHFAANATLKKIKDRAYWDKMNKEIREYCRDCAVCQFSKAYKQLPYGQMQQVSPPSHLFERIYVDILGPLVKSAKQNEYCLVVVCGLSRWLEVFPIRRAVAKKIADLLEDEIFCRFGVPKTIVTDAGSQFTSKLMTKFCKEWNIEQRFTAPYHHNPNMAERSIQTLKQMLQCYVHDKQNRWDENIQKYCLAIRTTINQTTGVTPAFLNLGREIPFAFDRELSKLEELDPATFAEEMKFLPHRLREVIQVVRENIIEAQRNHKKYFDSHRRDHNFSTGNIVVIKNHPQSKKSAQMMEKMTRRWRGPYRLGERKDPVTFEIITIPERKLIGVRHVSDIKLFIPREGKTEETLYSPECEKKVVDSNRQPRVNYRQMSNYNLRKRRKN